MINKIDNNSADNETISFILNYSVTTLFNESLIV